MIKLLHGLAVLPFMAGIAMAGQPALLSDIQMDKITAGAANFLIINNMRIPVDPLPANLNQVSTNTSHQTGDVVISLPTWLPIRFILADIPRFPGG